MIERIATAELDAYAQNGQIISLRDTPGAIKVFEGGWYDLVGVRGPQSLYYLSNYAGADVCVQLQAAIDAAGGGVFVLGAGFGQVIYDEFVKQPEVQRS